MWSLYNGILALLQKEVFDVLDMRERIGHVREKLLERVRRLYPVELRVEKRGGKAKGKD